LHSLVCRAEFTSTAAERRNRCGVLLSVRRWKSRRWDGRWCGGVGCAARRFVGRVRARTI